MQAYAVEANFEGADMTNAVVDRVDFSKANLKWVRAGAQHHAVCLLITVAAGANAEAGAMSMTCSTNPAPADCTAPSIIHLSPWGICACLS